MVEASCDTSGLWRLIVVGGATRNIGKTQLVCDIIQSFPKVNWIAGKITLDDDLPVQSAPPIGAAPTENICSLDWETRADTGTDSARFLAAGAKRSFWLRAKRDLLAECLPMLQQALRDETAKHGSDESRKRALIIESNSLLEFVRPSLFFAVIDPEKEDFKESAKNVLERANALVLRTSAANEEFSPAPLWMKIPPQLLQQRPSVVQRIGEPLPKPLESLIHQMLDDAPSVQF